MSAIKIIVGGFRPTNNKFASNFGLRPLALNSEEWPYSDSGIKSRPMDFICQLNLEEAPYMSDLLKDIKLITLFVDKDFICNKKWCLRAYKSLSNLRQLEVPEGVGLEKGFEVKYEVISDQPVYDDPNLRLPVGKSLSDDDIDILLDKLNNEYCSKLGGYPSNIQSDPSWGDSKKMADPKFCFQIDSEEKVGLSWGDGGIVYIARGSKDGYRDQWFIDCQFY